MKTRHLILGTVALAAVAGIVASKVNFSAGPPPYIAFEIPRPPELPDFPVSFDLPINLTSWATFPNKNGFQPPRLPPVQLVASNDLAAIVQANTVPPWEAVIKSGDTLDSLLARADLDAPLRAEIALALAAEYDLRKLRPGHRLSVAYHHDKTPNMVALAVDDGVQIEVTLDAKIASRTVTPTPVSVDRADQITVKGSIYASLDEANVPARFAVDLAQVLGGTVNFRRDLMGGERLDILWQQSVLADGSAVGQPHMTYVALEMEGDRFEIVWPVEESGRTMIYLNGDVLRTIAPPVVGARLSSVFGQRKHPIFGNVRMHTGVDYAAAKGTPVFSTAPGRISFIGWRSGYGRVVEVTHGSNTMTRYAHLSAVPDGMTAGDRVVAGKVIGQVGQTGTATAPNLHYEVHVDGRPIDPLGEDRLAATEEPNSASAVAVLETTRTHFASVLNEDV